MHIFLGAFSSYQYNIYYHGNLIQWSYSKPLLLFFLIFIRPDYFCPPQPTPAHPLIKQQPWLSFKQWWNGFFFLNLGSIMSHIGDIVLDWSLCLHTNNTWNELLENFERFLCNIKWTGTQTCIILIFYCFLFVIKIQIRYKLYGEKYVFI